MKLAKFALTCDGEKITSLEQLKEHFNLLDVLEHYKTNTLWRWLRSRGYQNELQGVEAIKVTQDKEILKALCEVFGIEADLQMIQEVLENRRNLQEQENEALRAKLKATQARVQQLQDKTPSKNPTTAHVSNLAECLKSYYALKEKLFNTSNLESSKEIFKQLLKDYADLSKMERLEILRYCYNKRHENYHFLILFFYMCHHLLKEYEFFTLRYSFKLDDLKIAETMKYVRWLKKEDAIDQNAIIYACYWLNHDYCDEERELHERLESFPDNYILNLESFFSYINEESERNRLRYSTICNVGTRGVFFRNAVKTYDVRTVALVIPSSDVAIDMCGSIIELPAL
ncbi:hypothetical protein [Helicobacter salomonis]|uniref:hypothetical protein n=1 Tax=Helicobacter salomonis TaxID=56878 RepID=UPI000CF17B81|nr:hypothetical protein [Helicobacter salomonis]